MSYPQFNILLIIYIIYGVYYIWWHIMTNHFVDINLSHGRGDILILNWSLDSVDRDNITIDIKLWLFQLQDGQQYSFRLAEGYPWTDCPEKGFSRSLYSLRYMSPSRFQNSGKFLRENTFPEFQRKIKVFEDDVIKFCSQKQPLNEQYLHL